MCLQSSLGKWPWSCTSIPACVQSRPNADTVKAMGKMIKQEGESTRTAIRSARRAALEQVKKLASKDAQRQEEKKVNIEACDTDRTDVTLLSEVHDTCGYVTGFTGTASEL